MDSMVHDRRALWLVPLALPAAALIGPLLVPVRPLPGMVPPEELADPDSRFVSLAGLRVHYKIEGHGQPALVLLHGFADTTLAWRQVMPALARQGTVVAFDRPGSGLTSRPLPGQWTGRSPYSPQAAADLTVDLMDALGLERAILVGNSAGGTIAVWTALRHADRVEGLVLADASVYEPGGPRWAMGLLNSPQARHIGPLLVRAGLKRVGLHLLDLAWHDPGRIPPGWLAEESKETRAQNWEQGIWELTAAYQALDSCRLREIRMPALVITGLDDRVVPPAMSERLARELPHARLVVIPDCGHLPQEEQPRAFVRAVETLLEKLRGLEVCTLPAVSVCRS